MSAFEMVIVFYHDLSLTGSLSGSFHQSLTFFCLPFDEPSPYQDYSICGASIDLVRAGTFRTICIKPEIPWREHERDWSTAISASTPRTLIDISVDEHLTRTVWRSSQWAGCQAKGTLSSG